MNKLPGVAFRRCESEDQAHSAAMHAARFHNALSDFEEELSPIGFPFHDMAEHMADLQEKLVFHAGHAFHPRVLELAKKIEAEVHRIVTQREGANASGGGPRCPSAAAGNADGAMAHRSCVASSDCAPKRLGAAIPRCVRDATSGC